MAGSEQHFPSWFQWFNSALRHSRGSVICTFHSLSVLSIRPPESDFIFFHDTAARGLVALSSKSAALHHCPFTLLITSDWWQLCVCLYACVFTPLQWVEKLRSHGVEGGEQVPPWEEDRERILRRYLPRWEFGLCEPDTSPYLLKLQEADITHIPVFVNCAILLIN